MSKRFDNKKLLFVLGALVVVLILTFMVKVPKEKSSLKGMLVDIDTTAITKIVLIPKIEVGEPFEFVKEKSKWTVRQGNIVSDPVDGAIRNIFSEVLSIRPKSLAAVDKSKWKEFELTDSLATRVKFLNAKGKAMADILIGKFSYRQASDPYSYSGGNNIEGTSHVRMNGEEEIYAVDGFLAFSLGGKFSDWRNKTFIKAKKEDILKISYTLPGDSSYVLSEKDSVWFAGEQPADSAAVSDYLNSLAYISGQDFKDDFNPVSNPDYQMVVEGNNLLNFTVKCFKPDTTDNYILTSSLLPDVYFSSKKEGIFTQIFKSRAHFTKE